jgi:hypothetical protein
MSYAPGIATVAALLIGLVGCGGGDDGETEDGGGDGDAVVTDAEDVDAVPIDAAIDAPIDAPPGPSTPFEVAYADRWTFRRITGAMTQGIGLVINPTTNGEPLDLTGFHVASVVDDHPSVIILVTIPTASAAPIPVGNAAGDLSPAAETHIGPMVTEPRSDNDTPSLGFTMGDLPMLINATVNVTAVLRNGSQQVTLPFVITLETSGVGISVTGARRVVSTPL